MSKLIRVDGPEPYEYELTGFRRWDGDGGIIGFEGTVPERTALKGKFQIDDNGTRYDVTGLKDHGAVMREVRPDSVPVIVGKWISGELAAR